MKAKLIIQILLICSIFYSSSLNYLMAQSFYSQSFDNELISEQDEKIAEQLRKMERTDPLFVYYTTLRRHINDYPGGKTDFEEEFAKSLNQTNISDDRFKKMLNILKPHYSAIRSKTKARKLLDLDINQPIRKSSFGIVRQPRNSKVNTGKYNLNITGIKSLRCADDASNEIGCDDEEPYIAWTCFGPNYQNSGVTEFGKFVSKGDEYFYNDGTVVFTDKELTLPLFFIYQVRESDPNGPSSEDISGVMKNAALCISSILAEDWMNAAVTATETIMGTITILSDLSAAGDDLYPVQLLPINQKVLDYHSSPDWDYHGEGGLGLFDKSPIKSKIVDKLDNDWLVVYFLYKNVVDYRLSSKSPIVSFFEDYNFKGNKNQLFRIGDFSSMNNIGNDRISSVVIKKGYKLELFEHGGFKGKSIILTGNVSKLDLYDFNDRTSSFKIHKKGLDPIVTFYQNQNFTGVFQDFHSPGFFEKRIFEKNVGNDAISSVKIKEGYKVVLYEHDKGQGKSIVVSSNNSDLRNLKFNDRITSFKIQKSNK